MSVSLSNGCSRQVLVWILLLSTALQAAFHLSPPSIHFFTFLLFHLAASSFVYLLICLLFHLATSSFACFFICLPLHLSNLSANYNLLLQVSNNPLANLIFSASLPHLSSPLFTSFVYLKGGNASLCSDISNCNVALAFCQKRLSTGLQTA